jgi:UDPglucose 6-dehydrogenase
MKHITIIGVGKLGLCLALNLERSGYHITGIDIDDAYIKDLNEKKIKTSEPLVVDYLKDSKNIKFTTDLSECLKTDVIFIVVKTPSTQDWKYDHSQIKSVLESLVKFGKREKRVDVIINSTTFPGYCNSILSELLEYNYYISYNPEFIAQGSIIRDQVNCDSVLIGEADEFAGDLIESIYANLCESNPIINRMSPTEAEIVKLSVNCFITTKISFANMIGDIATRMGCNAEKVLSSVGSDSRIGNKYLKPGFGFGGPCFPRDNRALSRCAEEVGIEAVISKATDKMNELHLEYQIQEFISNNPDKSVPVKIEYITYKKESILTEESQQLKFALALKNAGYKITVMDKRPEVLSQINNLLD